MKIPVTIGPDRVNYIVKITKAPKDYDGFGTFTLQGGMPDGERIVCIREEHLNWQLARYGSGMFPAEDVGLDYRLIESAIWARLWRGPEAT
jgi:hypothetical protein